MPASASLVQFRKLAGEPQASAVTLQPLSSGEAFGFFGTSKPNGYELGPEFTDYSPVAAGGASWEVWMAARFAGAEFQTITGIRLFIDSFDATGLGTTAQGIAASPQSPMRTGIFMRSVPGPIQRSVSPHPSHTYMPPSAPARGLPPSSNGWQLFKEGPGAYTEPGGSEQPEILDLTPVRPGIDSPTGTSPFGGAVLVSDPEPRYSNLAVLVLTLSQDAVEGRRNPAVLALEWSES